MTFRPVEPGVLTVATAFVPAPGFWNDRARTAGFEAAPAGELAHRLGLASVVVERVPFGSLVAGHLGGEDIALSQLSPTDEREKALDFTAPYLSAPPGVLALRRAQASGVKAIVDDQIRPAVNVAR